MIDRVEADKMLADGKSPYTQKCEENLVPNLVGDVTKFIFKNENLEVSK